MAARALSIRCSSLPFGPVAYQVHRVGCIGPITLLNTEYSQLASLPMIRVIQMKQLCNSVNYNMFSSSVIYMYVMNNAICFQTL